MTLEHKITSIHYCNGCSAKTVDHLIRLVYVLLAKQK